MSSGVLAPLWLRRVLAWLLPGGDRDAVLAELDVLYARRADVGGRRRATMWYAAQLPSFALRLLAYRLFRGGRVSGSDRRSGAFDAAARGLRRTVRGLVHVPMYTIACVATLGIGVGAISSVDAVANHALLRAVPGVEAPLDLVTILLGTTQGMASWPMSDPDLRIFIDRTRLLSGMAAATDQDVHVTWRSATPERVRGQVVTGGYFDVLGVRMSAGRAYTVQEADAVADPHVVVVSEPYARRQWGQANRAIGEELSINGRTYTVIGVAGGGFRGDALPGGTELWLPGGALTDILHDPEVLRNSGRQVWATMIGRPVPGATIEAISTEMNALMEAVRREKSGQEHSFLASHFRMEVYPGIGLPPGLRESTSRTLWILAGSGALLLLLACANVTNLGLARAASLARHTIVRRALGASAGAIAAERLTESTLVGIIGGGLGLLLSVAVTSALRASGLGLLGVPLDDVSLDGRVVAATILAGALAGMLVGVIPALATRRERASAVLRTGRRDDRAASRTGRLLVVVQVTLSVVLVVGGTMLARTLDNLSRIDLGVDATGVYAFGLDPSLQGYDQEGGAAVVRELEAALESNGIERVGMATLPPFESLHVPFTIRRPERSWDEGRIIARSFMVTPGLFGVLGIDVLAGRTFREDETYSATGPVAVLNESAARSLFPELQPTEVVGKLVVRRAAPEDQYVRVVGVVRDARLERPSAPSREYMFVPWAQGFDVGRFTVYARTARSLEAVSPIIRDVVASIDPALPVRSLRSWRSEIRSLLSEQRLVATLSLGLAVFGLLLAAVGLYGVLALAVTRRTREIGIRSALGARPARTLAGIVGSALTMTSLGVAPGLLASGWLTRVLESRLYGIDALDPGSFAAGGIALLAVAILASWLPARRAAQVDPMVALRE